MFVLARRLASAALATMLLSVSSCSGIAEFDVSQDIAEQKVPGSPLGALLPSFLPQPFSVTIDVKHETEKRDTGPASSANLSSLTFSITPHAAPRGNFDFVDEIHIFVEPSQGTATATAHPMAKVEIANLVPVPKGKAVLDLHVVPGVDLLPYINAGARVSAQASGHQPAEDVTYDGRVVVTVHI